MAPPVRSHRLLDPCGRFLPTLLYHDVCDRLQGRRGRARARWGTIDRPASSGKLLWIVSGTTRESVHLGATLARAILARRRDISLALTYEAEYPDIIAELEADPRVTCGYAPADYAGSMHAVWHRLLPFGVVLAGVLPRPNMIRLSEACRHALLVAPPGFAPGRYERIYPRHRQIYEGRNVAAASDFGVLMLPAASADDTRLADITAGRTACLWHGSNVDKAKRLYALFRGHLPQSILFVSGPVTAQLHSHATQTITLSAWAGQPVPPDRLVLVDEPPALASLMPNLMAVHLDIYDETFMWLALAAGALMSTPRIEDVDDPHINAATPSVRSEFRAITNENTLIEYWRSFDADSGLRFQANQSARQAYAVEHGLAQRALDDLLSRVSAWQ